MTKFYQPQIICNYTKTIERLQKNIRSGRFASYTQQKKQQVWNRLCRYARQLNITIKAPVAAACIAAGLCFTTPVKAQANFTQDTAANPLKAYNLNNVSAPAFVDIDGDGDLDVFIGSINGQLTYYKNTGTTQTPVYTLQTGAADPFNGITAGTYSSPAFADVDGDGDLDAIVGKYDGTLTYYKNTGTATAPVFVLQTGSDNPFDSVMVEGFATPTFVDIDGDGDQDLFVGSGYYGNVYYYTNTGTATAPVYTNMPSSIAIPAGIYYTAPTFVDIDGDGDQDLFIGDLYGSVIYYENTGTASAPVFTQRTGVANPVGGFNVASAAAPAFADIDGDGDKDLFLGSGGGAITFYRNSQIVLPLRLLSFGGVRQAGSNHLMWQTATETGTKKFEIEMSNDGHNFTTIASVSAAGSGNNSYSINDHAFHNGKVFYRLKTVDLDGRFAYSQVIWIRSDGGVITLYPNPAKDIITINTGATPILQSKACIYDGSGRLMQNIIINNYQQQINVQLFAKGAYQIRFADGSIQSFIKD